MSDKELNDWLKNNPWNADYEKIERRLYDRESEFRHQFLGEWESVPIAAYTREFVNRQINKGEISPEQGEELIRYRYLQLKDDEKSLVSVMTNEGIAEPHQKSIMRYLDILRHHHVGTYLHSIRVGVLSAKIAAVADLDGVDPKMMLWAGLLHDIGKSKVPAELLEKKAKFDEADYAAMEPHVEYGWHMLEQVHNHTAHIIVRHHRYGKRPYPAELPYLPDYLTGRRDIIEDASRLLALADYYDALTTRKNDRNAGDMTRDEKRSLYIRENPGFEHLILKLEASGVLTFE